MSNPAVILTPAAKATRDSLAVGRYKPTARQAPTAETVAAIAHPVPSQRIQAKPPPSSPPGHNRKRIGNHQPIAISGSRSRLRQKSRSRSSFLDNKRKSIKSALTARNTWGQTKKYALSHRYPQEIPNMVIIGVKHNTNATTAACEVNRNRIKLFKEDLRKQITGNSQVSDGCDFCAGNIRAQS